MADIEEPPHWFDLGRIAWEPAFSVSQFSQPEIMKTDAKPKEEDHKTQETPVKCPMCGCNVKSP